MSYKYFYCFLFTFSLTISNAQVSEAVKKLAQPLDNVSYAESPNIGVRGEKSKIYNQFKKVAKIASNDELYYFAMNGSNSLRVYAGQELFKRNDKRFLDIYTFYSANPLIMKYTQGCVGKNKNISEFLKDEVYSTQYYISLQDQLLKNKDKQDEISKLQLDQIKELGYGKLTEENINAVKKQLEKIDNKKSN
ncbi:hypothetical protein EGI15_17140 [Chryseobacterium cucumeris]|uniref:Uncharacterized protein n=1 Tax=Chryseobacterium cucumeris TaxID=1813611 RepID=A0ABX9X6M7_9FLAO|nr:MULTISPECIES: hypothetical protein [Chryseobacterium]QWT85780.1 hypothetical protein KBP46_20460 [Chryseobacterium sp. PCH239]ROH90391.1 hypothetical protein EGI15_17140 [Chryseobacterium cucumeris]